jgi:hypothetical protein
MDAPNRRPAHEQRLLELVGWVGLALFAGGIFLEKDTAVYVGLALSTIATAPILVRAIRQRQFTAVGLGVLLTAALLISVEVSTLIVSGPLSWAIVLVLFVAFLGSALLIAERRSRLRADRAK